MSPALILSRKSVVQLWRFSRHVAPFKFYNKPLTSIFTQNIKNNRGNRAFLT